MLTRDDRKLMEKELKVPPVWRGKEKLLE